MGERILVTGATGKLGREVVRELVRAGADVRAATRSPGRGRELHEGVEVVDFDYYVTETYDAAVEWVDRVFLTPPPFDPRADESLVPFLDWAVASGVRHLVLVTAMAAEHLEDLALRKVERRIEDTGVTYTFLRPNLYMQNFTSGLMLDGIRDEGRIGLPAGDGQVSFVDARDVAEVAAQVLTSDAHFGRAYTLTGADVLGLDAVAALLGAAANRPLEYVAIGDDEMRARLQASRLPADQVEVVLGLFESVREGRRAEVSPDLPTLLGRPARSFADFAAEHAATWREQAPA